MPLFSGGYALLYSLGASLLRKINLIVLTFIASMVDDDVALFILLYGMGFPRRFKGL